MCNPFSFFAEISFSVLSVDFLFMDCSERTEVSRLILDIKVFSGNALLLLACPTSLSISASSSLVKSPGPHTL
jgi:hypothetical protein